jgi:type VI secretion system protein
MALRLRIVSEHATRLGEKATKVFSVHGGTIGRATDNEWILPDPERYLSGKHARVDFRAGQYYLVDTSSNGTYVNGAQVPLGKFRDYAMKDGDYVRIGEFEMLVSIDPSNDFPPDEGAVVAYDGVSPSAAVKKSTANDLGADLDLSELLEPSHNLDEAAGSDVLARNAYGQPVSAPEPEPEAGTPWHMMTRPLKVERNASPPSMPPTPRPASAPLYDGDIDVGLSAFCRGAGIDPRMVTPEARNVALQLAGQLLREAVLGIMDLNQGRSEFRNRFRMSTPVADTAENAWTFTQGVEDTLIRLITTVSSRAGSVEAMRENLRELKAQNTAMLSAMRSALEELLARFEPKELEERFERGVKRGVFGSQNKSKYWDLYGELYASLSQSPPDGFPHLFVEAFTKAYEAKLRTLVPPRRGAFGVAEPEVDPDRAANGER